MKKVISILLFAAMMTAILAVPCHAEETKKRYVFEFDALYATRLMNYYHANGIDEGIESIHLMNPVYQDDGTIWVEIPAGSAIIDREDFSIISLTLTLTASSAKSNETLLASCISAISALEYSEIDEKMDKLYNSLNSRLYPNSKYTENAFEKALHLYESYFSSKVSILLRMKISNNTSHAYSGNYDYTLVYTKEGDAYYIIMSAKAR